MKYIPKDAQLTIKQLDGIPYVKYKEKEKRCIFSKRR